VGFVGLGGGGFVLLGFLLGWGGCGFLWLGGVLGGGVVVGGGGWVGGVGGCLGVHVSIRRLNPFFRRSS